MYENKRLGFLFVLPFVLGVLLFKLFPFVMSFALSFTQYDLIDPPQFVGLRNYEELATADPLFRQSLGVMPVEDLGAQLLGRVAGIAGAIVEAPEPRKIIVAIGSAWLLDTPVPPGNISARDVRREWFEAIRAMGAAGANYYVIDPRGVGGSRQLGGSTGLAREAGGYAFVNTNDFSGAVRQVLSDADHYYVIRVGDPPFGRKAVVRELEVKSSRRGVTIRARRGIPGGGA